MNWRFFLQFSSYVGSIGLPITNPTFDALRLLRATYCLVKLFFSRAGSE
jgi:hypothetical protein